MAAVLPLILPAAMELLKRFIPDQKEQAEAELKLRQIFLEAEKVRLESEARKAEAAAAEIASAASVIQAEVESNSWMARNWRPLLMICITILIMYNFMFAPIMQSLGLKLLITPIPGDMWTLLTISVGGYVAGKSGEKMVGLYADAKKDVAQANSQAEVAKFNREKYYQVMRSKLYNQGLTQQQVDAMEEAINEAIKG